MMSNESLRSIIRRNLHLDAPHPKSSAAYSKIEKQFNDVVRLERELGKQISGLARFINNNSLTGVQSTSEDAARDASELAKLCEKLSNTIVGYYDVFESEFS